MLRLLGAHDQAIISTYFPYYVSIGSIYPLVIVEVSEQPKLLIALFWQKKVQHI